MSKVRIELFQKRRGQIDDKKANTKVATQIMLEQHTDRISTFHQAENDFIHQLNLVSPKFDKL